MLVLNLLHPSGKTSNRSGGNGKGTYSFVIFIMWWNYLSVICPLVFLIVGMSVSFMFTGNLQVIVM